MIETLVKAQPLDNDVAVMKIIQLMGHEKFGRKSHKADA